MNENTGVKVNLPALKRIFQTYYDADKLLWDYFDSIDIEDGLNFLTIPKEDRPEKRIRHDSFIPAVVMLAFTVELGLKTLHFQEEGKWKREDRHDLEKAFRSLSPTLQQKIKEKICHKAYIDEGEFDKRLAESKDTFVKWRYFFDKDKVTVKSKFLKQMRDVLKSEII